MGDPPPGAVHMTARIKGYGTSGIIVVFQDPSSQLIDIKLTDANGVAWAQMPDGGFVTAVGGSLLTWAGVKPADALELVYKEPVVASAQWNFTFSFPASAGASRYAVKTTCAGGISGLAAPSPATNEMTLWACDSGFADFLITPQDADGKPTGQILFAEHVALPISSGGSQPELALAGPYETATTHSVNYSNVPADRTYVKTDQYMGLHPTLISVSTLFERTSPSVTGELVDTYLSVPVGETKPPVVFPTTGSTTTLTITTAAASDWSSTMFYEWGPMMQTYSLDVASVLLPASTAPTWYDAPTHTLVWEEGTAPQTPDFIRAQLYFIRVEAGNERSWAWSIAAPYGGASVVFPTLPDVGFDYTPRVGETNGYGQVATIKASGGYDAWRGQAFDFDEYGIPKMVQGASGSMTMQRLETPH
jgi:hypothetical protein